MINEKHGAKAKNKLDTKVLAFVIADPCLDWMFRCLEFIKSVSQCRVIFLWFQ